MRHLKSGRKLNRSAPHRHAMWRNMTTSLIEHGRIKTTNEKAKELRGYVERMITLAKKAHAMGDGKADRTIAVRQLHLRRQALAFIRDAVIVDKLFEEIGPRFAERPGGYTRIIKIGIRRGDAAAVSYIELLGADETVGGGEKKGGRRKPAAKGKDKAKAAAPKKSAKAKAAPVEPEGDAVQPADAAPAAEGAGEADKAE